MAVVTTKISVTPSVAEDTSTTSEPAAATVGAAISVDADTVWEDVVGTFTPAERSCIRDAVDEELLESVLDRPVLESSEVPKQWEVSIFSCLAPETARAVFLSLMIAGMENDEEPYIELTDEELSCLREWVASIDVADAIGALAEEDPAVAAEIVSGMFSCLTNLVLSMMVSELGIEAELSEEEMSCLREWVAALDMGALVAGFDDEDPAALGEFIRALFGCVPDVFLSAMLEEAGMALGDLTEDEASCLREWMVSADWSSLLSSLFDGIVSDDPSVLGEFVPGLVGCVPEVFLSAMLEEAGVALGDLTEDEASCLREWMVSADFGELFAGDPDAALAFVPDLVECIPDLLEVPPVPVGTSSNLTFEDATPVTIDEQAHGELNEPYESDLFVFDADQGKLYQIDVSLGTLDDSVVTLYDANESEVAYNDDYEGTASRILWEAPSSGTYYVEVTSYGDGIGSYTLTVAASDIVDDHSDTIAEATSVTVGEVVPGGVDYPDDIDLFVFDADQGQLYQIDVTLGTLDDSVVALYDSDDREVAYNDDYEGTASRILWEAPSSGTYYVEVTSYGDGIGSYTLTVAASDIVDDHSDTIAEATSVTVGEVVPGGVDYPDDIDLFVFDADQGQLYQIDVTLGTLDDSAVVLYDSDEWEVAYNDDYEGTASRILWEAPSSGTYYVEVTSYGDGIGSYTLTVVASDIVDDHSDTIAEATSVTAGGAVLGVLDYPGDIDLFVFDAVRRELYQIDVALGTLGNSVVAVYDAAETQLAFNDDYAGSSASRVFWEAPSSGTYYVAVASSGDGTGSYTLTIVVR